MVHLQVLILTKTVNLENASTALDVRVAASVRSSSSIKCFFRLSGGEETRRIEDIPFIHLIQMVVQTQRLIHQKVMLY